MRTLRRHSGIVVSALLLGGVLAAGIPAAQAATTSSPARPAASSPGTLRPHYFAGNVCDTKGTGICLNLLQDSDRNGTAITAVAPSLSTSSERWDLTQIGTVSSSGTFPFKAGSGLNATFNGDGVFQINLFADDSECVGTDGSTGSPDTVLQSCATGTGTWWVASGYSFVNRLVSDAVNSAQYLTSDGRGDSAGTADWAKNVSQWGETNGS